MSAFHSGAVWSGSSLKMNVQHAQVAGDHKALLPKSRAIQRDSAEHKLLVLSPNAGALLTRQAAKQSVCGKYYEVLQLLISLSRFGKFIMWSQSRWDTHFVRINEMKRRGACCSRASKRVNIYKVKQGAEEEMHKYLLLPFFLRWHGNFSNAIIWDSVSWLHIKEALLLN